MYKILVVDDEEMIRRLIAKYAVYDLPDTISKKEKGAYHARLRMRKRISIFYLRNICIIP